MSELVIYPWKNVDIAEVEKQLDLMLADHRSRMIALLAVGPPYTWENFISYIDNMTNELGKLWFPVGHLSSVAVPQDDAVCKAERRIYLRCLQKLSKDGLWFLQNQSIYRAYQSIAKNAESLGLTGAQRMAIENSLRAFRLSGVGLSGDTKKRFKQIDAKLTKLSKKFEGNVLDSTAPKAWEKFVTDVTLLDGLPEDAVLAARESAKKKKREGYLFSLGEATYTVVIESAKSRSLRREFYEARLTRASNSGPNAGKWDNAPLIHEILDLRYEMTKILGFKNFAELSLEGETAESTEQVMEFLNNIIAKAKPAALREQKELAEYALRHDGILELKPWDIRYYLKLVKEEKFAFSQDELSKYYSLSGVMAGVFAIAKKLYGLSLKECEGVELWHSDAKLYEVFNADGCLIGGLYTDMYERPGEKDGGAWMNEAVSRCELPDGSIQLPVGIMIANFKTPMSEKPSLLVGEEITTLPHEFGHNLQLLLTNQKELDISGTNGVPCDGVELASQFMENFCWVREGSDLIAHHCETGEPLPDELFEKVRASQTFGLGHEVVWLASRSLFDFRLHLEHDPKNGCCAHALYQEIWESAAPVLPVLYPWAPETFTHLFSGGYSAGYYSYLWANVLAADAFSAFVKDGKIDWSVGEAFQRELLSRGGSRPFMESFVAFRGRKPSIEPLLRQYGFTV